MVVSFITKKVKVTIDAPWANIRNKFLWNVKILKGNQVWLLSTLFWCLYYIILDSSCLFKLSPLNLVWSLANRFPNIYNKWDIRFQEYLFSYKSNVSSWNSCYIPLCIYKLYGQLRILLFFLLISQEFFRLKRDSET